MPRRSLTAPFGERLRAERTDLALVSRGLVVESGPQHRARQALRAAEHLSREVVEGLEEGVVVTDTDGRSVSWNASALAILEPEADHLAGREPISWSCRGYQLEDGAELTVALSPVIQALRTGRLARCVLRRPPADGVPERWITASARPIARPQGGSSGVVCTLNDITETHAAGRRLREERDRAKRFLEVASALVVVLDARGIVELVNAQGCAMLGFSEAELIGRDWFDMVVPGADRLRARMAFHRLVSGVEPPGSSLETSVMTRSGDSRQIAWRNAVLVDEEGEITSIVRSGEDVTERRRAEAQVAYLAYHDALTGLANRRRLEEQLERDLARARRGDGGLALISFDLDDFKLINDSFGHAAGDEVLQQVAARIGEITRAGDLLSRQGGDEFVLLMDCAGPGDPVAVAEAAGQRIADALDAPYVVSGAEFHVGASVGVALFPLHAQDAEALLRRSDSAMYQAKRARSGSVAVFAPEEGDARERLELTTRLRRAIGAGELRLHFQPIFRSRPAPPAGGAALREVVAVEALVRWEDPERGLVPPGAFIPIAEETGLIGELGRWVVEALCVQARAWRDEGFAPQLMFNLSPVQLRHADLVDGIAAQIAAHGLEPAQFCAELTETAVLSDATRQRSVLDELGEAGLAIALDDFGSGHSSLARLRDLQVDVLKVDRSFLGRVPEDPQATAVVAAILALGRAVGMAVVVEGVETEEQLAFLHDQGHPLIQGFLLGRPVPAAELVAHLPALVTA